MWSGYGAHMGWMSFWWIAGLAIVVWLAWMFTRAVGTSGPTGGIDSPETILKRRYAQGDISHEEFERRLADLRRL